MTGNMRQTAPELTWGTLWVTCDNSPTRDGTGPQKAPEGTEDMKSIDNLRDYVLTAPSICSTTRAILVGYIDGIDKEVAEVRDRDYRNGVEDGEMAAERDGWVRLPVDADGVPIHVGDVLEWTSGDTLEVIGFGGETLFYIDKNHNDSLQWTQASTKRHHHAPTVEDVLEEFVARWMETHHDDIPALKAEYAAKLALRGDE